MGFKLSARKEQWVEYFKGHLRLRAFGHTGHWAVIVLLCLTCMVEARAQSSRVEIKIVSVAPARVSVDLELRAATTVVSFRNAYAGVLGLGNRIERLEASVDGQSIPIKALGPGEYQSEVKVSRLRYEVNLAEPVQPAQMSHVSWLNKDHGLLMLADLIPRAAGNDAMRVRVEVPAGWSAGANIAGEHSQYNTSNPDKAVLMVGRLLRKKTRRMEEKTFSLISSGEWPFSDDDALKIAEKIVGEYSKVTGYALKSDAVVMLVPFAGKSGPEQWTAETRGNAVVLLLGNQASRKRVLAKLGIVLSHEIFHLWVPNALRLVGDYDWFFEGFTLYQALRMALHLKLISFDTYLETIARVYDSHVSSREVDRLSLIEASERRWTTASSLVYDKGMLAAFVYDLTIRNATDCERSLDDVYRQLFRLHATGQGHANETIINLLNGTARLDSFGRDYVESTGRASLQTVLFTYGLQLRSGGAKSRATKLELASDLNELQRKALRCIGYRG